LDQEHANAPHLLALLRPRRNRPRRRRTGEEGEEGTALHRLSSIFNEFVVVGEREEG
jgi:hypothetical protein